MKKLLLTICIAFNLSAQEVNNEMKIEQFKGALSHANGNYEQAIVHYKKYKQIAKDNKHYPESYKDVLKLFIYAIHKGNRCNDMSFIEKYDLEILEAELDELFKKDYSEIVESCAAKETEKVAKY